MTDNWSQFQQPQQGYAPPQQGYAPPQQGYAPPQQGYAPPPAPLAQAEGFADFWDQRATGEGSSLKFLTVGTAYVFRVTRELTKGDISQQTNVQGVPQFNKDGSPKWVLTVPGELQDGTPVTWWVKGQARTALQAAMSESGVTGNPQKGSLIGVKYSADRPSGPGFNPAKQFEVKYQPPTIKPTPPSAGPMLGQVAGPAPVQPQTVPPVQQPPAPAPSGDLFASMLED